MSFGKLGEKQGKIDEFLKNHKKVTKSYFVPCGAFRMNFILFWIEFTGKLRKIQKGELSIKLSSNDTHILQ